MRDPRIPSTPDAPLPATPWVIVLALSLAATSVSFMQTLVVPIQNHLPQLLDSTRSATAWVLTVSLVAAAVTTPISGRLADLWGKRRVLLALVVLLVLGSLIAALASGLWWLLLGRALQGVSMGVIAVGISILGDLPDRRLSVTGIAFVSASLGFGGALGLPLAAWIVQVGDWKTLFWSTVGLGVWPTCSSSGSPFPTRRARAARWTSWVRPASASACPASSSRSRRGRSGAGPHR